MCSSELYGELVGVWVVCVEVLCWVVPCVVRRVSMCGLAMMIVDTRGVVAPMMMKCYDDVAKVTRCW